MFCDETSVVIQRMHRRPSKVSNRKVQKSKILSNPSESLPPGFVALKQYVEWGSVESFGGGIADPFNTLVVDLQPFQLQQMMDYCM